MKVLRTLFLLAGGLSMVIMSIHYFDDASSGIQYEKWFFNQVLRVHIVCGSIGILTGPIQFLKISRRKYWHRKLGYVYATCIWIGSISGLVVASQAMGGWITKLGFSTLAVLWFYTMTVAVIEAKNGNIEKHRLWMIRNYALTFSSVTLRTMLALALIPGFKFMAVYQMASWMSWILNIVLLEWWKTRRKNKPERTYNQSIGSSILSTGFKLRSWRDSW